MSLCVADRDLVVACARERMSDLGIEAGAEASSCLYAAEAVIALARALLGVRLVLQAGSACWRAVPVEGDDGVVATHFGYRFEGRGDWSVGLRELPEMHCCAADPESGEVVDITTRYLDGLARRAGVEWMTLEPPDYIWADRFSGAYYEPSAEAIGIASEALLAAARAMAVSA